MLLKKMLQKRIGIKMELLIQSNNRKVCPYGMLIVMGMAFQIIMSYPII